MSTPYPGTPGPRPGPQPGPQWGPPAAPPPPRWAPPPPGPDPYGGGGPAPYGGGPGWVPPPPPGGYGGPPAPPPKRSRTGLVLALVGAGVVLALVAVAAVVAVTRSGDEGTTLDFGSGPTSEPEERWAVDLGTDDEDQALLSDGERVYVVADAAPEDGDEISSAVTITAYAASDGEELWETEVGSSVFGDPLRLLDDGQILVTDEEDEATRLLDAATGDEVWEADGLPAGNELALGFAPLLVPGPLDRVLLVTDDDDGDTQITVVDRQTGDEQWQEDGDEAMVCGDVIVTIRDLEAEDAPDDETEEPPPSEIVGRDADTGDELWSIDAFPGLCDEREIALGTDGDEVTLVDVASGEEGTTLDLEDDGTFVAPIPFGRFVAVLQFSFGDEDGTTRSAIYPRDGGDPTWEDDDAFAVPLRDDLVLVGDDGGDATLIRPDDGEEVGEVSFPSEDNTCDGALTRLTIVSCESGEPDVTAYAIDSDLDERWTVDVGDDVREVAIGGDRLFALTDDELVALG